MNTASFVRPPTDQLSRPYLLRVTPPAAVLLAVAAAAWTLVVVRALDMGNGVGTMGLSIPAFVVLWILMMAAMMLPSVAPLASMYARSVRRHRALRTALFASGYLAVWALTAVPAFALLSGANELAAEHPTAARIVASLVFVAAGIYQLSPFKEACLRRCRSPLALLLQYGTYRGRLRDLRAAVHHGLWCLGCCWALFALFVALGAMNLIAMVVITAIVLAEKISSRGVAVSRVVGAVSLALAAVVAIAPELAPGLGADGDMAPMEMPSTQMPN